MDVEGGDVLSWGSIKVPSYRVVVIFFFFFFLSFLLDFGVELMTKM